VVVVKHAAELRVHLYRQALLEEAKRLVKAGVLHEQEDAYYLTFHELHDPCAPTGRTTSSFTNARPRSNGQRIRVHGTNGHVELLS